MPLRGAAAPGGGTLVRDERGGVVMVLALALPVLFGFAALVVDASHLYAARSQLQGAANAAALAAARELPDPAAVMRTADRYAQANTGSAGHGRILKNGDVVVGHWNTAAGAFEPNASPTDAVKLTMRRAGANGNPVPTFFAGIIGFAAVDVVAEAVAVPPPPPVCFLALDPTSPKALNVGNGDLTADGCSVHVNSSAPDAIHGTSNGSITAGETCTAGGYHYQPTYSPAPRTGCPQVDDPLADLAAPTFAGCDQTGFAVSAGDATLSPGVYCGGIAIATNGTVTLDPGLYVIKDGVLAVSGTARLVGSGVTFYLTGTGAAVDFSGGASLTLTAPTTGPLAGILFFGARDLPGPSGPNEPSHNTNDMRAAGYQLFRGGSTAHYEGVIYFPSTDVAFTGNGTGATTSPHSTFIARRLLLTGNGEVRADADYGASSVPRPTPLIKGAKLVQ